jgi:hypothetical protein
MKPQLGFELQSLLLKNPEALELRPKRIRVDEDASKEEGRTAELGNEGKLEIGFIRLA